MPPASRRSNYDKTPPTNPKKNAKRLLIPILSTLLVLALIGGGGLYAVNKLFRTTHNAKTFELQTHVTENNQKVSSGNKTKGPIDGATDYLLVGADARVDMQGNKLSEQEAARLRVGSVDTTNTDVIMVMRVSEETGSVRIISIPRDTYVKDREFGNTKINAVYGLHQGKKLSGTSAKEEQEAADAGRQGLSEAVSSLTGVTIDHYVEIGLLGFVLLTDAVGGVDVCVKQDTYDEMTQASFKAGNQTLDGAGALSFVRQRHGLPRGDLDRVVRQQAYISGIISKLSSTGTITDPSKLSNIVSAVERSVAVDSQLNLSSTASTLSKIDTHNIKFDTIPVEDIAGVGDHGESVVKVDVNTVQRYFSSLLPKPKVTQGKPEEDRTAVDNLPSDIAVVKAVSSARVYAAGRNYPAAYEASEKLKGAGVVVTETAMAPDSLKNSYSQVMVRTMSDSARKIGEIMDLPVTISSAIPEGNIIVIVDAPKAAVGYTPPEIIPNVSPSEAIQGSGAGVKVEDKGVPCIF